jgi:ADP-heptose:LPS heptosyltransferase
MGLSPGEDYLLVAAGARAGSSKGYPTSAWAAVLDEMAQAGAPAPVLIAGPGEEARVHEILGALKRARAHALLDPCAGLAELAAWAAGARMGLCAAGGTRHVAKAVGATTVTIYGPTDPRHTADWIGSESSLQTVVPCGPCHLERCPLEGVEHHACMHAVHPGRVAREGLRLLDGSPPRATLLLAAPPS